MRALPAHERLHKGPELLQYVADGGFPDELWGSRGTLRSGVFCGYHERGCAEAGAGVDGRCRRTVFQRFCAMRWHGNSGAFKLCSFAEMLTTLGLPLRSRRPLLEGLAPRPLVDSVHR
jgi:hypothetical protein